MVSKKQKNGDEAIRNQYETYGVSGFYDRQGANYRNPHEETVREILKIAFDRWTPDISSGVLDLASGSGEVTLALREIIEPDETINIQGADPFTYDAYRERTGQVAERFAFEEIASGALAGRSYSLIVCSFALHLVKKSRLPQLMTQLGLVSSALIVLTPNKRPEISPDWGWELVDEILHNRVRARLYQKL